MFNKKHKKKKKEKEKNENQPIMHTYSKLD